MTTGELIKLLQEEDPSGKLHVRLFGDGIPCFCEVKPGYWDGPYAYIENNKWIQSTEGSKVDIYTKDINDFIWDDCKGKIKGKIKVNYTYIDNNEMKKQFLKKCEESAEEARTFLEKIKKSKDKK